MAQTVLFTTVNVQTTDTNNNTTGNVVVNILPTGKTVNVSDHGFFEISQNSGAAAQDFMPARHSGTEVSFFAVLEYNSGEPVATRFVSVNQDAVGVHKMDDIVSGIAGTSFTIQTGTANAITGRGIWYIPA